MKVGELIATLQVLPRDAEVFCDSVKDIYVLDDIITTRLTLNEGICVSDFIYEREWQEAGGIKEQMWGEVDDEEMEEYRSLVNSETPIRSVVLSF